MIKTAEVRSRIAKGAFGAAFSVADKRKLNDHDFMLLHSLMSLCGNGGDNLDGAMLFIVDAAVQTLMRGYEYSGEEDNPGTVNIARMLAEGIRDNPEPPTPLRAL